MDRSYDTRKVAALEVTSIVKSLINTDASDKVFVILKLFVSKLISSHNEHNRKGGLLAIAATIIGIGSDNAESYLSFIIPPVLECFNDNDVHVSYYACEALFNILKVCRTKTQPYFSQTFEVLCTVLSDLNPDVQNGARLLENLLRDVGAEVPLDVTALADSLRSNSVGLTLE